MKVNRISIIANTIIEPGMSGGNRIFIECAKRWLDKGIAIDVFTSDVGEKLCRDNGLNRANYVTWTSSKFRRLGTVILYLIGTVKGCLIVMKKLRQIDKMIIYSSSDFWPDSIPAFIAKLRNKDLKWIAAFYLFAQNPFGKESPYRGRKFLKGLLYWLSQIPTYWLIKKYADMVFVTNEPDRVKFVNSRLTLDKVVAVRGGVDTKTPSLVPEPKRKKYDAVFIGRFHPQKGVLELIDIWRYVCDKKPNAKLAVIGKGDLEKRMKEKIREHRLENNIDLLGFKDGIEKIRIFKESRMALYPATLDHWSMAPVEAMICGLPLVTFDISTLKFLHPRGMIRVPCYDLKSFAEAIGKLLNDKKLYQKTQRDSIVWAKEWDWDKRAEEILNKIKKLL